MPNGTIQTYDPKAREGTIQPESNGEALPFSLDDVVDHKTGEIVQPGAIVTYEEEDGRAVKIHRAAKSGYV